MLITSYGTTVHAQVSTIWNLLLDRVEHPEVYQPAIREARILERYDDGILREMVLDDMRFTERITVDDGALLVHSELVDHPEWNGFLDTRVLPTSLQNPMAPVNLDINVHLELKPYDHKEGTVRPEANLERNILDELNTIRIKAEEQEARENRPGGSPDKG